MTRVRTDNTFGTLTDNPLLVGATTMNSAGLANLAVVSSAEAIIILDPNRLTGAPEIVVVTAHTGSATSATIVRGQFGTTARQHAMGTEWVHGPIASNASSFVTPADDQGDFVPMNAWEAYTPTLTQSATVTKTVDRATFVRQGRVVTGQFSLSVTGAGTAGNAVRLGLPVAAVATGIVCGTAWIYDASANVRYALAVEIDGSVSEVAFLNDASAGNVFGVAPAVTLASGDLIRGFFTYEAAS